MAAIVASMVAWFFGRASSACTVALHPRKRRGVCVCVGGGAAQGNRVRVKVGRGVALLAHKAGGW